MEDDRLERLLGGYALPDVPPALDRRVRIEAAAIFEHEPWTVSDIGRSVLGHLGFGYLVWLADLVTTRDAEYRVELI